MTIDIDFYYAFRLDASSPEEAVRVVLNLSTDKHNVDRLILHQRDPVGLAAGIGFWGQIAPTTPVIDVPSRENWGHYWITCTIHIEVENEQEAMIFFQKHWGEPSFSEYGKILFHSIKTPENRMFEAQELVDMEKLYKYEGSGDVSTQMDSYLEKERKRCIEIRNTLFNDPGGGDFRGKPREFILQDPLKNLFEGIREHAIDYFNRNTIPWWMGGKHNLPSGHLLSSQVSCVNHLFWLRTDQEAASQILNSVSEKFVSAEIVDDGYVEFEVIGERNYLGERSHSRGANATSIDAVMIGKQDSGEKILVMIEWKYTESYRVGESKYIPAREEIYDPLLLEEDCPIKVSNPEILYYEPFYQLMRQAILGWKMVQAGEYGCTDYLHVHVIPAGNKELLKTVTSPGLSGYDLSTAWKGILEKPEKYLVITPENLIWSQQNREDLPIISYLKQRYWVEHPPLF